MIREALCVRLGHYWIRQAFEDHASHLACLYCGQPYTSAPGDGGGTPGRKTTVPGPAPHP